MQKVLPCCQGYCLGNLYLNCTILRCPGLAAALQVVHQFDELVEDNSPHRDALLKVFLRKIKRVKHREAGQSCGQGVPAARHASAFGRS